MKAIYGLIPNNNGGYNIHPEQSAVIKEIYRQYLSGKSLGGIANHLFEQGIPSPTGKARWSRSVIDHLFSNGIYAYGLIPFDVFYAVQVEKDKRSNIDPDSGEKVRKATQYNSRDVLSGLLVCADCGFVYWRVTRPSGEVVWRCSNRVKNGKKAYCHAPSIPEVELKETICKMLDINEYDPAIVKAKLVSVRVTADVSLIPEYDLEPKMELAL